MISAEKFLQTFCEWATSQPFIEGIALVGSHARGTARPDSDIDLIILCSNPAKLLEDTSWIKTFGEIESEEVEDYGPVTSLRTFYKGGLEVEFGITTPEWAAVPVDPGTRQVASDGIKTLFDPESHFEKLIKSLPSK